MATGDDRQDRPDFLPAAEYDEPATETAPAAPAPEPAGGHGKTLIGGAAAVVLIGGVAFIMVMSLIMMLLVGGIASVAGGGLGGVLYQSQCNAAYLNDADIGQVTPVTDFDHDAPVTARVATYNTLKSTSASNVVSAVEKIGAEADVIGLQELSTPSRRNAVDSALIADGWGVSDAKNAVQIVWRKSKYQLLAQGSILVFGVERTEPGASGLSIGPKSVQWVQLRDRETGGVFFHVNHHIVPTIESGGHLRTKAAPKRAALYKKQMAAFIALTKKLDTIALTTGTGDFNFDARKDGRNRDSNAPYVLLGQAGIHTAWRDLGFSQPATHAGGRYIDYVTTSVANSKFLSVKTLGHYNSDHRAVVAVVKKTGSTDSADDTNAADSVSTESGKSSGVMPTSLTVPGPRGGTMTMNASQIHNAAVIIAQGKANNVPSQGWVVALATAWQESTMNADLDEAHSDRDSAGLFQQRRPWGPLADRMDPAKSANMFYTGGQGGQRGLLDIPGWEQMSVARVAQSVQVSAFPSAYAKWEAAAREIVKQLDGTVVPGTAAGSTATNENCPADSQTNLGNANMGTIDMNAPCPLDSMNAPGRKNPHTCNEALAWMQQQSTNPTQSWYRRCLSDVAQSYGWGYSGTATAYLAGVDAKNAGVLSTDTSNIPRGAVMYWSNGGAGHVAVYDGEGYIWSNDVLRRGKIDRVPWDFPTKNWGQTFMGWAPPYFPKAGGSN